MHSIYTLQRRKIDISKEQLASNMGISLRKLRRIMEKGGNVFETACIRTHLHMPPLTVKEVLRGEIII